ncbi:MULTISPECIES: hypothetical protein [Chryseobacterium]|uniref:Uncharacterized protein n=1 Tax=Chryseobacterium salivictor TaxID=2547600 RepID=A0A4P6ZG40_9FLAO|nr:MULTISPECIES: hypothetical protein [Chryseobacterium]MDQ0477437.1 hypothetical protein [Chryseobacterium sp. MDT2-18]QBO58538.1 hypothetical protein NBC122_01723 [Chryseobacterium salivictor]
MEELNNLELTLLNALTEKYPSLKSHIPYLKLKERKNTGVGMLVDLEYVNGDELNFDDMNALFSNGENIEIKGLKQGLNYVIDVTDGKILYIEFSTYGENWNGEFGEYKIIKD